MSDPILPFAVWAPGTNQNSIPANDNALRSEILNGDVISESTTAQPGSPADGDIYIIPAAATGAQWSTFDQYDLTIYKSGTWYAFAPVEGIVVNVAGVLKRWTGAAYTTVTTLTTLGVSAYMQTLLDDATALAARNTLGVSPRYRYHAFTDCAIAGSGGGVGLVPAGAGTAAAWSTMDPPSSNFVGVIVGASGTTTSGRTYIYSSAVNSDPLLLGGGVATFYARAAVPTLSTGSETFSIRHGFFDTLTGESTDAVMFRYTHSVNGGKWEAVCRSNNVETAADTGVTVAAGIAAADFETFEITVNAGATSVEFKIDGAVVATITTNIPSGAGRFVGHGCLGLKSAGTTSTQMLAVDLVEISVDLTTPR
jgi:hypothetical protein